MITFEQVVPEITLELNKVETEINNNLWSIFEQELDVKLPSDYKKFINHYGTGCLGELIWILNPFAKKERFNLKSFLKTKKAAYLYLEKSTGLKPPFPLFSDGKGILPFAFTDNGDTIYWNVNHPESKIWTIVLIDSRDSIFEEHSLEFSEFLFLILKRTLESSILILDELKNNNFNPLKINL